MTIRSLLPAVLLTILPASAVTLWQEGEAGAKSTMHRHPWWYDQVKKDLLSGGDWMSNFGDAEGTAEYSFAIPESGKWTLWLRANPVQATLEVAVDGGDWQAVDFAKARGQQNIAADGKPDLRFIAWVDAGVQTLEKGAHTIAVRMRGGPSNHGGLDCLVLTNDGFVPQGIVKPGAAAATGPTEWFPLPAGGDPLAAGSVIDLSPLIPAPAGQFGAVIARGKDLAFAGKPGGPPVKFWGVNANQEQGKLNREESLRRIGYLRKFGVNIVRQHTVFDEVSTDGRVDPAKLAEFDWWFSELKKVGIYMDWSVFYHFPVRDSDGYDPELLAELEPMGGKGSGLRDTYGLITVSPELQAIRTRVMVALLEHRNPHTGLRYADDPALAMVEFQNEDSVFFWNPLGDLAAAEPKKWPRHARRLRQQWCAWVKAKYSSDDKVKAAWGKLGGESLTKGELALMGPWELDQGGIRGSFAGQTQRAGDQIRFLAEMQRGFYETCEKAVRATGFKAQTVTTNWLGGSGLLDQANIWTDTVGSMIDRHNYAGGGAGGHGITEGGVFAESHLQNPGAWLFSIGLKQVGGKPFSLTEWTMSPPNRWKLEAAPIVAFYGLGLQGWDASFHFAQSGAGLGEGWPQMTSYATDTPHYMGQFPALAFAVYKGHFRESEPLAARHVSVDDLFTGKPAWKQDYYNGNDLVRDPDGVPQEIFAEGRVTVDFDGGKTVAGDLTKRNDKVAKVIRSTTDELTWDYGRGLILVQSAKTQGVIGRTGGKVVTLPGVTLEVKTEFVSLLFTPLDDLPLTESRQILLTAMAQDKQAGARYSADGTKLEAVGTPPLMLEPVQAKIRLGGAAPARIRPLDRYGVPMAAEVKAAANGTFEIDGTSAAYYYEITR